MRPPIKASEALTKLNMVSTRLNGSSLSNNISELRRSRSTDRIQQLQTEAIVDLYDAVKQIQEAIWPMLLIIPDGVEAARQAAQNQGATTSSPTVPWAAKLSPGPRFTR